MDAPDARLIQITNTLEEVHRKSGLSDMYWQVTVNFVGDLFMMYGTKPFVKSVCFFGKKHDIHNRFYEPYLVDNNEPEVCTTVTTRPYTSFPLSFNLEANTLEVIIEFHNTEETVSCTVDLSLSPDIKMPESNYDDLPTDSLNFHCFEFTAPKLEVPQQLLQCKYLEYTGDCNHYAYHHHEFHRFSLHSRIDNVSELAYFIYDNLQYNNAEVTKWDKSLELPRTSRNSKSIKPFAIITNTSGDSKHSLEGQYFNRYDIAEPLLFEKEYHSAFKLYALSKAKLLDLFAAIRKYNIGKLCGSTCLALVDFDDYLLYANGGVAPVKHVDGTNSEKSNCSILNLSKSERAKNYKAELLNILAAVQITDPADTKLIIEALSDLVVKSDDAFFNSSMDYSEAEELPDIQLNSDADVEELFNKFTCKAQVPENDKDNLLVKLRYIMDAFKASVEFWVGQTITASEAITKRKEAFKGSKVVALNDCRATLLCCYAHSSAFKMLPMEMVREICKYLAPPVICTTIFGRQSYTSGKWQFDLHSYVLLLHPQDDTPTKGTLELKYLYAGANWNAHKPILNEVTASYDFDVNANALKCTQIRSTPTCNVKEFDIELEHDRFNGGTMARIGANIFSTKTDIFVTQITAAELQEIMDRKQVNIACSSYYYRG